MKHNQPLNTRLWIFTTAAYLLVVGLGWAEVPKDILYFGNSFTNGSCCGGTPGTKTVPELVADIAVAAGHVAPRSVNAAVPGQNLQWHRLHNSDVISAGIAPGETWDIVVLQDFSTEPTHLGNLALHRISAVRLYQLVAAHSPSVVPVMFETWARPPGHSFYTGEHPDFPGGPAHMQQELREGYRLAAQDINTAVGANLARYAPAGDAWENAHFDLSLYAPDNHHSQDRGTLLNALVLYGTIYEDRTTRDIDLTGVLNTLKLTAQDGAFLTGVVDATLVPEPACCVYIVCAAACIGSRRQ